MPTSTAPLEGQIEIALRLREGVIDTVDLRSTRPQAARVFVGRSVDEVIPLLSTVFSLCGTAQRVAGLTACERARSIEPAAADRAARAVMVLVEAAEQNLMRVCMDWPMLLGEAPDPDRVKDLREAMAELPLDRDGRWRRIGGGTSFDPAAALGRLTPELEVGPATSDLEDWQAWWDTSESLTARCLKRVAHGGLSGFGASDVAPLPVLSLDWLEARLGGDDNGAFAARPEIDGGARETGPLSRLGDDPLIAAARERYGNGLMTRMLARLVDLDTTPDRLRTTLENPPPVEPGPGIGVVETARGTLVHRVELDGDTVADYRIVAPTEWNFHPDGPLARGLLGANFTDSAAAENQVALLTAVIDPCVGYEVTIDA